MKKRALTIGVYDPKNIYQASPLPSDSVFAKGLEANGYDVFKVEYRSETNPDQTVLSLAKKISPDLFWLGKAERVSISTIEQLKQDFPDSKFVKYACDVREIPQNHDLKMMNYMDLFAATFGGEYLKKHKEFMPEESTAVSMITFTDSDLFKHFPSEESWKSDILWTGRQGFGDNLMRNSIISFLRQNKDKWKLKLYGIDEEWLGYPEYNKAICNTKIGIGANSFNRDKYSSDRLGNYMSSGTFYLAHYFKGIEEVFKKGFHLDWFHTIEEMESKIEFYLKNEEKREKIAKRGQKFVLKHFDSKSLVKNLLTVLETGKSNYKFDDVF